MEKIHQIIFPLVKGLLIFKSKLDTLDNTKLANKFKLICGDTAIYDIF